MVDHPGGKEIMTVQQLKALLAKARKGDPVNCAIALTDDKQPLVLLDRKRRPRQLAAALREQAKDAGLVLAASTLRFGHVEIDGAEDARTVIFRVEKAPPGTLAPRLTVLLRKAGFGHVEIVVDDDDQNGVGATLETGPAPTTSGPGIAEPDAAEQAALAAIAKSVRVWEATLRNVERQVDELHEQLTEAYGGHGFAEKLDEAFHAKVRPMLENLDASLTRHLADISAATGDKAARGGAVSAAMESIERCESYLAVEPLIAELDANPLVPLSIRRTLVASLGALHRSVGELVARPAA